MKMIKNTRNILPAAVLAAVVLIMLGMTAQAAPEASKSLYVIDKNGAGDFTTIQEGVNHASDGDTLVIYPGVYTEEVSVMGKGLNIIGVGRDACILQYNTDSYAHMPLTIGAGKVSNLTIYGMTADLDKILVSTGKETGPGSIASFDSQIAYQGYAVHIDQSVSYGRSLSFENCRIVSENNHCVGIGGRGGSTITFENCEMMALRGGGCIYMHDPILLAESGEMAFALKNCLLINCRNPYVMTFQSYMPEVNSWKLTFQNTRVRTVAYEEDSIYIPANVNSTWKVETLMRVEDDGGLYTVGLTSTVAELVHELTLLESKQYGGKLNKMIKKENRFEMIDDILPEGITYLHSDYERSDVNARHQVIAIYNKSNTASGGWCGLDSAYLTPDSFGNTLPEMNAPVTLNNPYMTGALTSDFSYAH